MRQGRSFYFWRHFILGFGIIILFWGCFHSPLNSTCDPNSSSYNQTLVILLGTGSNADFCGNKIQNPFKKIKTPRFLLVTNVGLNTATSSINVFRIEPITGEITQVSGSPFQMTDRPRHTVSNESGTTVYVANIGNTSISILNLDPETGALSVKHPNVSVSTTPYSLAMDPGGKFLYASSETTQAIHRFAIDQSGNLSSLLPSTTTNNPNTGAVGRLSVDSMGRHLYAGLTSASGYSGGIQTFAMNPNTGELTPVSVIQTGQNNLSVAITPDGQYVYGANYFSNNVFSLVRDLNNGTLTIYSNHSTGIAPGFTMTDSLNRFVFVANSGTGQGTISAYSIQSSNGELTSVIGSPFPSGLSPIGLSSDPLGKFLYSSNTEGGNVSGYTIGFDGSLAPISGFPVTAGINPFSIEMVSY
ncbi:lactonase [Leptospira brenneri]|uniref:Lactonase n=1 Tax=Leptospira brenneri TaxID=2023182 RepID=A0A5F1Z2J7_9LEPT|nr:lactonase [Leptospira brenneri]